MINVCCPTFSANRSLSLHGRRCQQLNENAKASMIFVSEFSCMHEDSKCCAWKSHGEIYHSDESWGDRCCIHVHTHMLTHTHQTNWKGGCTINTCIFIGFACCFNACVSQSRHTDGLLIAQRHFGSRWIYFPTMSYSEHIKLSPIKHTYTQIYIKYMPEACNYLCICEWLMAVASWWLKDISLGGSCWHLSAAIGLSNSAENKGWETH